MLFIFRPRKNEAYSDADEAPQGHQRNCNEPEQLELFGIAWNAFRTRRDALGDQADIKQIVIDSYSQAYQAHGQGVPIAPPRPHKPTRLPRSLARQNLTPFVEKSYAHGPNHRSGTHRGLNRAIRPTNGKSTAPFP